ncbi:MAG: hypothetical protein AAGA56_19375 [Myxococcota bacterium]
MQSPPQVQCARASGVVGRLISRRKATLSEMSFAMLEGVRACAETTMRHEA